MITLVIMFEKIIGAIMTQRKQQAPARKKQTIFAFNSGVRNCPIISIGFIDIFILPSGSGQNGSEFGS